MLPSCITPFQVVLCAVLLSNYVFAFVSKAPGHAVRPLIPIRKLLSSDAPVTSRNGTILPPYSTVYYFDQLIDHRNPNLGTFKQRYWHTYEFYEPGGPIILTTPGETNADESTSFLTNRTITGMIAQQQNGTTVILEHRFFGLSNPYPDLSVESFKFHTIQQAINDLAYFAQHVVLPMPGGDQMGPNKAPWILVGGSYSGALISWTMVNKPGIFWAGYSSSGVVEAITDFWAYFEPIRQNMPRNCSADVQTVLSYIDTVFTSSNQSEIDSIKSTFGLSDLTHPDDVVSALKFDLYEWQDLQPYRGSRSGFYQFCDALEVNNGVVASETGFGLEHALRAWGEFFATVTLPKNCDPRMTTVVECLDTYDPNNPVFTNITVDNEFRSWSWIVCNEVGYYQEAPPAGQPAIVSRLLQPAYDERICELMFPKAFRSPPVPRTDALNAAYKGWDIQVDRLFFANGLRDPWRDATVSAVGLNRTSTDTQPIFLSDGFHCSDLYELSGQLDPTVNQVQQAALSSMASWIAAWKPPSPGSPHNPTSSSSAVRLSVLPWL